MRLSSGGTVRYAGASDSERWRYFRLIMPAQINDAVGIGEFRQQFFRFVASQLLKEFAGSRLILDLFLDFGNIGLG